jgi:dienelactone hydrolase
MKRRAPQPARVLRLAGPLLLVAGCAGAPPTDSPDAGAGDLALAPPALQFLSRADPSAPWMPTTRSFFGDQIDVRASGLPPSSPVTLVAQSGPFQSSTDFHTDASGALDVASAAPDAGGYQGADPDGPFWSMVYSGSGTPVEDYPITLTVSVAGQTAVSATLQRYWTPDGATSLAVSSGGLVGRFVAPAGSGPFPALITFGGSEGGLGTGQLLAEYWAARGYACLGLAYFGAPGLPPTLDRIPLEYFATAIQWLKARPEVDGQRIGVMGGSRGGELALLLGATYPDVKAVVATAPSGLTWPASVLGTPHAAWTLGGNDLAFVPGNSTRFTTSVDQNGNTLYAETPSFLDDLQSAPPAALAAATTAVDKTNGAVLMLAGEDDQLWPSCMLGQFAVDRLQASGHWQAHGDELQCYPNAGHAILAPGLPTTTANEYWDAADGIFFNLGGTPAGIAHAERDADGRIRDFLQQHL